MRPIKHVTKSIVSNNLCTLRVQPAHLPPNAYVMRFSVLALLALAAAAQAGPLEGTTCCGCIPPDAAMVHDLGPLSV
jgi:hypothetical protein